MSYGLQFNANDSIYGQGFKPWTPNSVISANNACTTPINFLSPFSQIGTGADCFNPFDNSNSIFFNTLNVFEMFMNGTMPSSTKTKAPDENFNTNVILPTLLKEYNPEISNKLANIAYANAKNTDTIGHCYHEVKDSLKMANLDNGKITGESAYQAANPLKHHENFQEVRVAKQDLKNLPAGCVIVWEPFTDRKGKYHEHGHIAVTLGNGQEASDHVQTLLIGNKYSVYLPKATNKKH